ncbi:MAG: hypothetical protein EHM43_07895 [Ignavibacteriae bacterium]|nr:MAG: hypothetical protein EHM43_07895 [Ignavibacteriota bacterium]
MSRTSTVFLCLLLCISTAVAIDHDDNTLKTSPFQRGSTLPDLTLVSNSGSVNLASEIGSTPTIVIRFLGYSCTHCVEQLTYLNRHAGQLRTLGIRVIAFSSDDVATCDRLMRRMKYDPSVISVVSDPDNAAARTLDLVGTEQNDQLDLHGAFVIRKNTVELSIYSTQPYMDIERLVSVASANDDGSPVVASTTPHAIDRYLSESFAIATIAGPTDGIVAPIDLDFNKSPLHPNDLWVVTTDSRGHGIAIIHDAPDAAKRTIRLKKDSRASHCMWRTLGIAMGSNGAFGTAQNGENGDMDPFYQFMGPTLWSSDTAVFASRYQDDRRILASHLDMLHQSPMGLGIAHDHDNVFWVSCGYYGDITRYDFQDPHEVGGTDHRDGIIRRYPEATLTRGDRGRPAHMALDHTTGWLYYIDPGTNTVSRLNTRTGTSDTTLIPPPESGEYLQEYTAWKGASVAPYITTGLGEPVGIDVVDDRLLIGDRLSGTIHVYAITPTGPERLGSIATKAQELLGLCVGPDGRIWCVDRTAGSVLRLELEAEHHLAATRDVALADRIDTVRFNYTNASASARDVTFTTFFRTINERGEGEWVEAGGQTTYPVAASGTTEIAFEISVLDTLSAAEIMLQEVNADGSSGVKASTFVIPRMIRRALVDDAQTETYRIGEALDQTERPGYARLRSDLFLRVADSLLDLQTVLWNGGSFGEISSADDAILLSLLKRKIEVFLVADDPLILRTDMTNSLGFFSAFGTSFRGADLNGSTPETGQRVFTGVPGDSVSGGLALIDCQLPRLNHHRGGEFVPNVYFTPSTGSAATTIGILNRTIDADTRTVSVRHDHPDYRTIVLGINAARFLDGVQRTTILRQGLIWLEAAEEVDVIDTVTSVEDRPLAADELMLIAHANPIVDQLVMTVRGTVDHADIGVFSVTGQRLATLHQGAVNGEMILDHAAGTMGTGTYFVVARTATSVQHLTIIKR